MTSDEQAIGGHPLPHDERPSEPRVLDEIEVEDLAVDGICGVY